MRTEKKKREAKLEKASKKRFWAKIGAGIAAAAGVAIAVTVKVMKGGA